MRIRFYSDDDDLNNFYPQIHIHECEYECDYKL